MSLSVYDYRYVHMLGELADRLEQSGHAREASEIRSSLEDLPENVLEQLQQREGLPAYRGGLVEWNNQSQVAEDARAEMVQLFKRYMKLDVSRADASR